MFVIIPYRTIKMRVSTLGILGLGIILAAPATAQTLTAGKWTGTLNLSSGAIIEVEFTVQGEGDAMQIVMNAVAGPVQPVTDVELSEKAMSFTWGAFNCSLERKNDKKYEGDCEGVAEAELTLDAPTESSRRSDVLTGEQLVETQRMNVYEAVRQLRPRWLTTRGGARAQGQLTVSVYIGRQRMGGVDFLETLDPQDIGQIRFYSGGDATTIFGTNAAGGVLEITRR